MKHARRTLSVLLRLGLGLGIIAILVHYVDWRKIVQVLSTAAARWPWLLAAHALLFGSLATCVVRWKLIMRAMNLALSWPRTFAVFLIGHFFNTFMPGGTGGDLIKAYYTARETAHRKTEAVASIFIDRTTGLFALALLITVMILARYRFFLQHPESLWAPIFVMGVCLGGVVFLVFLFRSNRFADGKLQARWQHRPKIARLIEILARAYDAFYTCRQQPVLLVQTGLLSVGNQFFAICAGFCVSRALGMTLPFLDFATLVPIIGIIGAMPITLSGLGVREGASIQLYATLGVPQAEALLVSFLPYVSMLLWGLLGGILFPFYSSSAGGLPKDVEEKDET